MYPVPWLQLDMTGPGQVDPLPGVLASWSWGKWFISLVAKLQAHGLVEATFLAMGGNWSKGRRGHAEGREAVLTAFTPQDNLFLRPS